MEKQIQEGTLVLCTVDKIQDTTVFVRLDDYGNQGTITFPEVAPGRIRNIRDYAFPGKKIICKVLQIHSNYIELSLRRVKTNERSNFNENWRKERSYTALLKTNISDAEETIKKIKETESLVDFIDSARENPKILSKYLKKEEAEKITRIIQEKKQKESVVSRQFKLSTKSNEGIIKIKRILSSKSNNAEIAYISAGKYIIKIKSKDLKSAEQEINKNLENIEALAKKENCYFNLEN